MSSSSSSSASGLYSSSRRIQEENENLPLTGILLGLQKLEERIVAEGSTTCTSTSTQQPVPLIIDIIGCDITIEDIQSTQRELLNEGFDLKKDVNKSQLLELPTFIGTTTPMIHFCQTGNLLIVRLLFLIGADCSTCTENHSLFPIIAAAQQGHLDICKWLFEYGDAKYQINKETNHGDTPLQMSYIAWCLGRDKEGKICRWLLQNGGGQHLSSRAMRKLRIADEKEEWNPNRLVLWIRENIQLQHTFILLLCGTTTMITLSSSSSLEPNDDDTRKRKHNHTRERKRHRERSLQILDGHPGIMELIGKFVGVLRGKKFRMLQEFNELIIEHIAHYR